MTKCSKDRTRFDSEYEPNEPIDIYGKPVVKRPNEVIVIEEHRGVKGSRYAFLARQGSLIHVSSLASTIEHGEGFTIHHIPLESLDEYDHVVVFWSTNRYVQQPLIYDFRLDKTCSSDYNIMYIAYNATSGIEEVDETVDMIMNAKRFWVNHFLPKRVSPENLAESLKKEAYRQIALLATYGTRYRLGRKGSLWNKLTKEYQNYVLAHVDITLSTMGQRTDKTQFNIIQGYLCAYLNYKKTFSSSGEILEYIIHNHRIKVYLEQSLPNVKTDILISTKNNQAAIECKQGPSEKWIKKAIDQAKRYKKHVNTLMLVSIHKLSNSQLNILNNYYEIIVHEAKPKRTKDDNIIKSIKKLTENLLAK